MRSTVITESNIERVEKLYKEGMLTYDEMGKELGLSASVVYKIADILRDEGRISGRHKMKKKAEVKTMYGARLKGDEVRMLEDICKWTGKTKSEAIRNALYVYYISVTMSESITSGSSDSFEWRYDQDGNLKDEFIDFDGSDLSHSKT